jgi:hypothetical protein
MIKNPAKLREFEDQFIWLLQLSAALESTDLLTTFSDLGKEFPEGGA